MFRKQIIKKASEMGLSNRKLAMLAGVRIATVYNFLEGNTDITVRNAEKLCKVLELGLSDIENLNNKKTEIMENRIESKEVTTSKKGMDYCSDSFGTCSITETSKNGKNKIKTSRYSDGEIASFFYKLPKNPNSYELKYWSII